jgi:hypothetical protein
MISCSYRRTRLQGLRTATQTRAGSAGRRTARIVAFQIATAIVAALYLAACASAQELQGMHGVGHDKLHHWYETLRQPGSGYGCCDNKDCRPTVARVRDGILEVVVDGEWTKVPPNVTLDIESPDVNTHVCAPKGPWSPKVIFCVVLGLGV